MESGPGLREARNAHCALGLPGRSAKLLPCRLRHLAIVVTKQPAKALSISDRAIRGADRFARVDQSIARAQLSQALSNFEVFQCPLAVSPHFFPLIFVNPNDFARRFRSSWNEMYPGRVLMSLAQLFLCQASPRPHM